jgi:transposase
MKNVRPYRARTLVNFVETEGIEHMEWPAVSPDMNPIENLWSEITRTMDASANQPTNLAELRQAVIDVWQAMPLQTLENLIDSMPRRVQALYDARGGHTKY